MNLYFLTAAELLLNVARGALTLTVGKLLYDATGSLLGFAVALSGELLVSILTQYSSGIATDKWGARKALVGSSLAFLVISAVSLITALEWYTQTLVLLLMMFQLVRPFVRSAIFAVVPMLFAPDKIEKVNGKMNVAMQIGQLIGLSLAGVLLEWQFKYAIFILLISCHGLVFLLYLLLANADNSLNLVDDEPQPTSVDTSYKVAPAFFAMYVIAGFDIVAIGTYNLLLAPVIKQNYGDSNFLLAAFDGAFTVGAILAGLFITQLKNFGITNIQVSVGGQLFALGTFLSMTYGAHYSLSLITSFLFGIASTASIITWYGQIQKQAPANIRGKVFAYRQMWFSVIGSSILLLISQLSENLMLWQLGRALVVIGVCMILIQLLSHLFLRSAEAKKQLTNYS